MERQIQGLSMSPHQDHRQLVEMRRKVKLSSITGLQSELRVKEPVTSTGSPRKLKIEVCGFWLERNLNLTISRFGQVVSQWGEESTVETPTGTVLIASMRQRLGKDQNLSLTGTVDVKANKLKVNREGTVTEKGQSEIPWPEGVVGLVREPKLFKELNLKVGESFDYPSYIPMVNWVVKTTLTCDGEETKVLWPNTPARKLLRFTAKPAHPNRQWQGKTAGILNLGGC